MKLIIYALNKYVIFVVMMLLLVYPYIIPDILGLPEAAVIDVILACLAVVLLLTTKNRFFLPNIVVFLIIFESITWTLFALYHNDRTYLPRVFFLLMTGIVLLLLTRSKSLYKFGFIYNGIICLQGVLGAIAFVLIFVGILEPIKIFEIGERNIYFYGLTSSNTVIGNFVRIGGFFDEPGALAAWGVFALVINKLVYDNRKIEILLMISLLFTFSAAYFVILPLYILFFFFKGGAKKLVVSIFIIVPIIVGSYYLVKDNEEFLWLTTERFQDGEIRSARNEYSDNAKRVFKQHVYMGAGGQYLEKTFAEHLNDNPFEILAKDGLVGYIVSYLPLFALCFVFRRNKEVLLGSLLLFICYQQRPFHINEMHFFMILFYTTIVYNKYKGIVAEKEILNNLTNNSKSDENSSITNMS